MKALSNLLRLSGLTMVTYRLLLVIATAQTCDPNLTVHFTNPSIYDTITLSITSANGTSVNNATVPPSSTQDFTFPATGGLQYTISGHPDLYILVDNFTRTFTAVDDYVEFTPASSKGDCPDDGCFTQSGTALCRTLCPPVTGYPTIALGSGATYYGAYDAEHGYVWVGGQSYAGATYQGALYAIGTELNQLAATYPGSAAYPQLPATAYSMIYDSVHNLIVIIDQFQRWDSFDPAAQTYSTVGALGSPLYITAGALNSLAFDSVRGHVLAVATPVGGQGGVEVVSFGSATSMTRLYNSGYTLPQLGCAVYSAAIDKFVVASGGPTPRSHPFFYLDPVTWAVTSSSINSSIDGGGDLHAFDALGTGAVAFRDGSDIVVADVVHDSVIARVQNVPFENNSGLPGGAYNSCTSTLYFSDFSRVYKINAAGPYQYLGRTDDLGVCGLYFEPYSGLVYGISSGGTVSTF